MTQPAIITVPPAAPDAPPYYEAYWRVPNPNGGRAKAVKRRIGKAWVQRQGDEWVKRRGKAPDGWFDHRSATVRAAELVRLWEQEQAAKNLEAATSPTVRQVASEWLAWKRDVKGCKPSTLVNDAYLLAEPGTPHKRGNGRSEGHIMARWGDTPIDEIAAKPVSEWLRTLDSTLSPRSVNERRKVLHAICAYAMRADTYALPSNPVAGSDKRREPTAATLDFYEQHEVEGLAALCEQGLHRKPRHYKGRPVQESASAREWRQYEDRQDAAFFRTLLYSGMRLGEARALRWRHVDLQLDGAVLSVELAVSDQEEGETKGRRARLVPLPRVASQVLAGLKNRGFFDSDDDYVFINRTGTRIDDSAIRRRYKRACALLELRPLRLHDLRHAAGSHVAREGSNVFVRDFLGHSKLAMTDRYVHAKLAAEGIATVNRAFGSEPESESEPVKENA